MMLLLLLTTLSSAPHELTPPRPPVISIPVDAATEATLTALLVVSAACFPEIAVATSPITGNETDATLRAELVVSVACFAAIVVAISTPAKYS